MKFLWSSENGWKFNIFALFEHAYNFGLKFCSYFKNNVLSDSILCIFIMMWLSTINFTPVSVKIKFLWSSENDWKFNIFALFEHAYSFGLKFCSYFKNNVLSDSFFMNLHYDVIKHIEFHTSVFKNKVFIVIWKWMKHQFLWENCEFFPFLRLFFIYSQANTHNFFSYF